MYNTIAVDVFNQRWAPDMFPNIDPARFDGLFKKENFFDYNQSPTSCRPQLEKQNLTLVVLQMDLSITSSLENFQIIKLSEVEKWVVLCILGCWF